MIPCPDLPILWFLFDCFWFSIFVLGFEHFCSSISKCTRGTVKFAVFNFINILMLKSTIQTFPLKIQLRYGSRILKKGGVIGMASAKQTLRVILVKKLCIYQLWSFIRGSGVLHPNSDCNSFLVDTVVIMNTPSRIEKYVLLNI